MLYSLKDQQGQSLIELLVAMTVFVLVVSSIMFLVLDAQSANRQGGERSKATLIAQEGSEAALSITKRGWRYLAEGDHGIDNSAGYWDFQGNSNVIEDKFTRQITVEPVYRDGAGNIVESGGNLDFDTKKVISRITWDFTTARPSEVALESYLTNWKSIKWKQTTQAEFNQGVLDQTVVTAIDDGEVELTQNSPTDIFDWDFDNAVDYVYNPAEIEVVFSQARLVDQGSGIGSTLNPGFETSEAPWVYYDWSEDPGDVDVTGRWNSNIGQSDGGVEIKVPRGRQYQVGGFYEQMFTIDNFNPPYITASLSWQVNSFRDIPQSFEILAFIDDSSGEPLHGTEIWSSGQITDTTTWATEMIDVTSLISTPGTYYYKFAVWVEAGNQRAGAYQIRFDDVAITWDNGTATYPTTNPAIQPDNSLSPADVVAWNDFQEIAIKNGGEIYYQLSDDDGLTWYFWDGASWSVAGDSDYNIASEVSTNISQFPAANKKIIFKAFLSSNGTQQVVLDNIRVIYEKSGSSSYATLGTFESSALDTGITEPVYNYLDWTIEKLVGTNIEFQTRTADTQSNLSSATWVGPDGTSGTFYTAPGTIIEFDPVATGLRWIQYKAYLYSDGITTPVLKDITLDYET